MKPICPYCNGEMQLHDEYVPHTGGFSIAWCICPKCGSRSPIRNTGSEALSAALQWYVEPNRVLTLEELGWMDSERSIYFETRESGTYVGAVFESSVLSAKETFCDEDESADAKRDYGVSVRCWLRRPTDEERQAAKWEAQP